MNKRQTASIPLLIASIIMMLSTVMPHHHHGDLICFTVSHCEKGQISKTCDHDHEHDTKSSDSTCEIQQLFQTDVIKQDHGKCPYCSNMEPGSLFFPVFVILGVNHSLLFTGQDEEVPPPIYAERLHSITWNTVCAGRAPPIAIA